MDYYVYMSKIAYPSVETTKDFILIKIPRNLTTEPLSSGKISKLEYGLHESLREASIGKLIGPFKSGGAFLRALKKSTK